MTKDAANRLIAAIEAGGSGERPGRRLYSPAGEPGATYGVTVRVRTVAFTTWLELLARGGVTGELRADRFGAGWIVY